MLRQRRRPAPDESFVLVVETARYRVRRSGSGGELRGRPRIHQRPAGLPDGVTGDGEGHFCGPGLAPQPLLDALHPHPALKRPCFTPAMAVRPAQHYDFVLGADGNGRVVRNLHPDGKEVA